MPWLRRGPPHGVKVVLADVEEDANETAADRVGELGKVMAAPTDVSLVDSVDEQRRQAEAFGQVSVACNNAGVAGLAPGPAWKMSLSDWEWVLRGQSLGRDQRHPCLTARHGRKDKGHT